MIHTDVFICGGGPAGLAAAIACRLQGFDVVVADSRHPPIDKPCGEGLLPEAIAALSRLGVELDNAAGRVFHGIRFVEGSGSVEACFRGGIGIGVRRTRLHEALHQRAAQLGVRLLWGTKILGISHDLSKKAVTAETNGGRIHARWCIGADGLASQIRKWADLTSVRNETKRIGLRTHFSITPWSSFVEVHWTNNGQAYVTPTGPAEVCLIFAAKNRYRSVDDALVHFPRIAERIAGSPRVSDERGAATMNRRLHRVTRDRIALIGDASGSIDAITGAGLGLAFQQAVALSRALRNDDLTAYEHAHREIRWRSAIMSHVLLQIDRITSFRKLCFASFQRNPAYFERLLAIHAGEAPLALWGRDSALALGLQILCG